MQLVLKADPASPVPGNLLAHDGTEKALFYYW